MSKKIVKKIRESVDYLLQKKIVAPLETQKVIDFLFESTFFDKDDDFFQKIVKAEGYDAEKYQFFNGKRYTRQPDGHYRDHKGNYLHRVIWEFYNGKIPHGYLIHHKDLNPANNSIENLQLMSKIEHNKLHSEIRQPEIYTCENCGKIFERKHKGKPNRFCCRNCAYAWHFKNSREVRICVECGKEFLAYKKGKTKYCSKECIAKLNSRVHSKKNKNFRSTQS